MPSHTEDNSNFFPRIFSKASLNPEWRIGGLEEEGKVKNATNINLLREVKRNPGSRGANMGTFQVDDSSVSNQLRKEKKEEERRKKEDKNGV